MKFEELCEKAYNLLLEDGFKGFYLIKELSDKYEKSFLSRADKMMKTSYLSQKQKLVELLKS